ncbi:unnamed protein product [Clavelina lepadiformis]|uniref:Nucleoside diphosphate kinase-like domain-containing protein n=1 Tax=Clavelina lepadiformis TaxID=159417 RepID=A0ABP0FL10_CLALP
MGRMQITLAILKPDVAVNPHIVYAIDKSILRNKFLIIKRKRLRWPKARAEQFYFQHAQRFFYRRLVEFMSSGPIEALILAKRNAIQDWRLLIGPTKVYKTQHTNPNTIRGQFGLTDTRNAVHGADSEESVHEEVAFFFPEFDVGKWNTKGHYLIPNEGSFIFDNETRVHKLSLEFDNHEKKLPC